LGFPTAYSRITLRVRDTIILMMVYKNKIMLKYKFFNFIYIYTKLEVLEFQLYQHWVLQVMFPSLYSFIVCWFPLFFTTCFGLHGHRQVCRILRIFIFIYLRILLRCFFFWFAAFFTWSHSACFPFVFCSCAIFLRVVWCFLAYEFVCLLFIQCRRMLKYSSINTELEFLGFQLHRHSNRSSCFSAIPIPN
jgi:hypothetical protein